MSNQQKSNDKQSELSVAKKSNAVVDVFKWILVLSIVLGVVVANQYFANSQPLLYRVLGVIVMGLAAVIIAFSTTPGKQFWQLLVESKKEIRRITWPTKQETMQMTLVVLAVVFVSGLFLWGVDSFFGWMVSNIVS